MSYTNVFGGQTVAPADPSYLALTISASVALVWPLETTEGSPGVAAAIDVIATAAGLSVAYPPGDTGSTGPVGFITNLGTNSFTVTDAVGNPIAIVASTQSWLIVLTDNSTAHGTWRALQLASTTSSASAAALAGGGLQANGSQLQVIWNEQDYSANAFITQGSRATLLDWVGAAGTFQFDTIANLGVGWYCAFQNNGTDVLTLTGSGGQTVNGVGSFLVQPENSGILICAATGFYTVGALSGPLSISNGGTGASTAGAALTNLGGTATGISIFEAPNAAAVVSILGLNNLQWAESTVSTDQTISGSQAGTALVCTAKLTVTLPLTTSCTTKFLLVVYAQGGPVTLAPQPADKINNGTAGTSLIVPIGQSLALMTDAAGNWWPFFLSRDQLGDYKETSLPEAQALAANPGWHTCAGQTRPRTDPLWVTYSGTWPWGNGDGSTTYTLPDRRGRVSAGVDNMNGTAANRITAGGSGISGVTLGAAGGIEFLQNHSHVITIGDPGHNHGISDPGHSHSVSDPGHFHTTPAGLGVAGGAAPSFTANSASITVNTSSVGTGITINAAGTGISAVAAITGISASASAVGAGGSQNVQPTVMNNVLIYCGA